MDYDDFKNAELNPDNLTFECFVRSTEDGSHAMLVWQRPKALAVRGNRLYMNECGDTWIDRPSRWTPFDPAEDTPWSMEPQQNLSDWLEPFARYPEDHEPEPERPAYDENTAPLVDLLANALHALRHGRLLDSDDAMLPNDIHALVDRALAAYENERP